MAAFFRHQVLDGHGGREVALFCQQRLPTAIGKMNRWRLTELETKAWINDINAAGFTGKIWENISWMMDDDGMKGHEPMRIWMNMDEDGIYKHLSPAS